MQTVFFRQNVFSRNFARIAQVTASFRHKMADFSLGRAARVVMPLSWASVYMFHFHSRKTRCAENQAQV